jgi:hypothetical protein
MMKWMGLAALLAGVAAGQGCALFLVGAAAGAGAGTASYMGNELHVTQEVNMDRAWSAANAAMQELQFRIIQDKTVKDATSATVYARNAKDQEVCIRLNRQSDRLTDIRVRVGTFDTTANREMAQLLYDKMKRHL